MNPSLALIPSAYSAGKLYSVLPEDGTGDFDVSRNGTATYLGSDGLIKTAQANEPRLEFNPDGSFKGVLVEPAATNVLLNSETPVAQTLLMTAAQRTISFYGSGTVTLSGAFSATITGNANPLIRTTFTFTPTATNLTITPSGDVTKWQLETGLVATSYIPTEGSIVTRPADVITRTNAQDLIGQTEGTMFCYLRRKVITDNVVRQIFSISSGVNTNRSEIYAFNNMIFVDRVSPTQSALSTQGIIISSELIKIAFTYKSGNSSVFINGVKVMTFTATFIFNTLNRIAIGNSSGGITIGNNNTISAALFKTALTDEQAISITSL